MKLNEIFLPYAENYKEYSCQENWYTAAEVIFIGHKIYLK